MGIYVASGIIGILILTNALTLYWGLKKRLPASKEALALKQVLAAFEAEGRTILRIEKINPDHVFLRGPSR